MTTGWRVRISTDSRAIRRRCGGCAAAGGGTRRQRADIYAAVAAEIGQRLGADVAAVLRYERDATATIIGGWGAPGLKVPVGRRMSVEGEGVVVEVQRSGGPARVERFHGPPGSVADTFRKLGVHTGVGCPIVVEAALWGVAFAASNRPGTLPEGSEARIAEFTELVSTAIANAEGRAELQRVADEQAALRRVAMLVARRAPADEILGAVASETRAVLDSDISTLLRLEPDGMITVMASESALSPVVAVGEKHKPLPGGAVERALQTRRTARSDGYEGEPGSMGDRLQALGYGASASAPIVVEDRLWGAISVIWGKGRPVLPGSEHRLMQFGELIATALANAEARGSAAGRRGAGGLAARRDPGRRWRTAKRRLRRGRRRGGTRHRRR